MSKPDDGRREVARIGWHPVDTVSLVAGLLAVGVALMALLDVDLDGAVVLPTLLVVAGLLGLVAALRHPARQA